jgi:hypothetical protein
MVKLNKKVYAFLSLSVLSLLLLNLTFVGSYLILTNWGSLTLNPGENYTLNFPFSSPLEYSRICGTAEKKDGTPVSNVEVFVKYKSNSSLVGSNMTNNQGKYCIFISEMEEKTSFDIFVEYDNDSIDGPLSLLTNDYSFQFENNLVYNKSEQDRVFVVGNITNQDARIENGRFEIKVGYNEKKEDGTNNWKYLFGDYELYSINISPNSIYSFPNSIKNISWEIPQNALPGEYKFLYKSSFNAKEKLSQSIFFEIVE